MENITKIYVLVDPNDIKIRYIGITCQSLKDRLSNHIQEAKFHPESNWHKANWIRKLLSKNQKPIIRQLCICNTREEAEKLESKLITKYIKKHNLVNVSLGNGQFTSIGQHSAAEINSKEIFVYNYKGEFIQQFKSIKECAKSLDIYISCVEKCLYGIYKYAKGYQFSYTKVEFMPSLENYSTGSSKQVLILDTITGEVLKFKSGVECKKYFEFDLKTTANKYLLGAFNKKFGNRYMVNINGEFTQSTYYNTGVIIKCKKSEYKFKSKKELISYMGYKTTGISQEILLDYINKHFTDIEELLFNQPLCLVTGEDN